MPESADFTPEERSMLSFETLFGCLVGFGILDIVLLDFFREKASSPEIYSILSQIFLNANRKNRQRNKMKQGLSYRNIFFSETANPKRKMEMLSNSLLRSRASPRLESADVRRSAEEDRAPLVCRCRLSNFSRLLRS